MTQSSARWETMKEIVRTTDPVTVEGRVVKVVGLTLESLGPPSSVGEICFVRTDQGEMACEVVGFREERVLLMPLGRMEGIAPDSPVRATGRPLTLQVGPALLGRVLDGLGRAVDGKPHPLGGKACPVLASPPPPLGRPVIDTQLQVGVRVIDGLFPCGRGQRLGIFAGSGVGKSTLLGMIARNTSADVTVIGLIGERGREVREFLDQNLGEEGLRRSVVVVATSDDPPMVRIKAAQVATAIAEYFRDRGQDVVLMVDSLTRFAMALREVGLAVGEPPTARGYTPSVFSELPRLLERTGRSQRGSITGFYTVLMEGDDEQEPVTDAVRAILDGHLMLSRELAARHQYPAVDVLHSVSRLMSQLVDREHLEAAARFRRLYAAYRDGEDLLRIGAYREGSDPELDEALRRWDSLQSYLRQETGEAVSLAEARRQLLLAVGMGEDA